MRSWRRTAYQAVRPLLFASDAERIHQLTLAVLSLAGRHPVGHLACRLASGAHASSPAEVMGLRFRNRVGVAAGFDKDGEAIRGWAALGLGHVELGTVTPRAQPGNPRPRLFRLTADEALVNRMGFNNGGADALARRVAAARPLLPEGFVVGVNIGRNRETPDDRVVDDYVQAAGAVASAADYLTVNISSPNTPGLRELQRPDQISELVAAVAEVAGSRPLLVKLSPDLNELELDELVDAVALSKASGLVLANTTVRRDDLRLRGSPTDGGLSGRPLLHRTLSSVAQARERAGQRLAIIASGGIGSATDASLAIDAGADLVQLWTGLVFGGPGLIGASLDALRSPTRRGT